MTAPPNTADSNERAQTLLLGVTVAVILAFDRWDRRFAGRRNPLLGSAHGGGADRPAHRTVQIP